MEKHSKKIDIFVGKWFLIGSISINSEVKFIGEIPDPKGVINWLNGKSGELVEQMKPTDGLTLTITKDKRFKEEITGNPQVRWFNYEGVESDVTPFNGQLNLYRSNAYLIADGTPSWATPMNQQNTKIRYDDGDTKISDFVERKNEYLIRTINVVTDDLYLDRVVIVYQKAN